MYTQCPECSTVFRVTAEALRTAQGRVRCGICSSSFNALDSLNEQPQPRPADESPGEDTITVEELPGTEFIELSAGLEAPTQEESAEATQPAPDDDAEDTGDAALEFHGTPDDLERLFVAAVPPELAGRHRIAHSIDDLTEGDVSLDSAIGEVAAGDFSGFEVDESPEPWLEQAGQVAEDADPGAVAERLARQQTDEDSSQTGEAEPGEGEAAAATGSPRDDLERTDEYPILVLDETDDALVDGDEPADTGAAGDESRNDGSEADKGDTEASGSEPVEEEAVETSGEQRLELLIPEELRRGPAAAEDTAPPADDFAVARSPRPWGYLAAAVVLCLVLGAQLVHHARHQLVMNPVVGPWLLRTYAALGLTLEAPADLAAFDLRQLGAASEPGQAGRLKLRASIVNRAVFAQPLPVLRLTLQDRFGSTLAARDLEPTEYLPGGAAASGRLLGPSQRADAEVVFVDPGREAVGFELDVCVRTDSGLRCSNDSPAGNPR